MEGPSNLDHEKPKSGAIIELEKVTEGKANVIIRNEEGTFSGFYNPAQEFNRDLSIAVINTYMDFPKFKPKKFNHNDHKYKVCEPLAATGLRSIRYYHELNNNKLEEIHTGDMDINAVKIIERNAEMNQIDLSQNKFKINHAEANQFLYSKPRYFDVIDLDPYGTAVPFLDSAFQSILNGGLMCVTFTDLAILCGNYQETCYYKYGSIPFKGPICHETAMRIALFCMSSSASKYKKVLKPLLSINAEFYIRFFFIVNDSPEDCKLNCTKHGYMFHCKNCQNRTISPLAFKETKDKKGKDINYTKIKFNSSVLASNTCEVCESQIAMTGPYWIDNMHDEDFVNSVISNMKNQTKNLKYEKKIESFLNGILEEMELKNEVFSYDFSRFSRDLNVMTPKLSLLRGALDSLGYKMTQSYYDPNLFKTNCPTPILYDIFKLYKKNNYEKEYFNNVKENTFTFKLLSKEVKCNPKFYEKEIERDYAKYIPHPFPNWGPKTRTKLAKKTKRSSQGDD